MSAVKRIEIVVDALQLQRLLDALDRSGLRGYTVLPNARGRGKRGMRRADELTDALKNAYVLAACPPEKVESVIEAVRPLLQRFGGVCLVSDAEWIEF